MHQWRSIQVLPNQVNKKSFHTFEDIDVREFHATLHKKPSETLGADSIEKVGNQYLLSSSELYQISAVVCTKFVDRTDL